MRFVEVDKDLFFKLKNKYNLHTKELLGWVDSYDLRLVDTHYTSGTLEYLDPALLFRIDTRYKHYKYYVRENIYKER